MRVFLGRTRRTQAIATALTCWLLLLVAPLRAQEVESVGESAGEVGPQDDIGPPVRETEVADDQELVLIQDDER